MDQEQSQAGPELSRGPEPAAEPERTPELAPEPAAAPERTPEQVREDIEQTRIELGDTVAALAEKADVKGQAKQAVTEARATVTGKVAEVKDAVTEKRDDFVTSAREATPESAGDAGQRVTTFARRNALPLAALAALGVGWLIGRSRAR